MDSKKAWRMARSIFMVTILLVSPLMIISGESDAGSGKRRLAMGTCPAASGMYPWLAAHGTIINRGSADLDITVIESPGGVAENQKRINRGDTDFGWGCVCSVWHNIEGTLMWKGNKRDDLRLLAIVIEVPVTMFVREDSGVKSLYELEGKPYGTGVPGSVTTIKTRSLFDSMGISPKFFEAPLGATAQAVRDGRIVGFSKTGAPDALILDIAATIPIRVLPLLEKDFEKARSKYPIEFSGAGVIPARAYPGQDQDVFTYSDQYGWTTSSKLPEEAGYQIVKTWYENRSDLAKMYAPANNPVTGELDFPKMTLKALKGSPIKLHAGAVKFYKDIGLQVPDQLIPPEAK